MSFLTSVSFSTTKCISRCGIPTFHPHFTLQNQNVTSRVLARFKSGSARPPSRPAKSVSKPFAPNATMRRKMAPQTNSKKNLSPLLDTIRKSEQPQAATAAAGSTPRKKGKPVPIMKNVSSPRDFMKVLPETEHNGTKGDVEFTIDEKEEAIQQRIVIKRRQLLWPGIWTLLALTGTYGTLAYLDVKAGVPSSDGSQLPERTQLPQTWYITPTVVIEGVKGCWRDLDYLSIGIISVTVAVHFLKKSPLPIWENLIHITGERKWTAFTYPLVNTSWGHAAANMGALIWFMPSVVRYFDGDLFHTSAFFVSIPLITSYITHFAYRFNFASGLVLNMGASGAIAAVFGAYCAANPHEKVWVPWSLVFRLDAMYFGLLFAATQAYSMFKIPTGGNRPAYLVHLASMGLGAAYAYFDLKHHLWIPLVSEISSTQDSQAEVKE